MAESKLGQFVGNAVAGILLFALVGSLGSCAFGAIGRSINDARHPELAAQRRANEAEKAAAGQREAKARIAADTARNLDHARKMRDLAEQAHENENRCIRQMDYETCRRIYHPTPAEKAAQQAIVDRAARIAEAYRDQ